MLGIDRTVPLWFDYVMLSLPWLGTNLTLMPILVCVSVWLWVVKKRPDLAMHLMVVAVGSLVLNAFLKEAFARPRPELWPHRGQFKWSAYPSGHAIVGVAVFFTIAELLYRERDWWWPFVAAAGLLLVSLYSRVYLGVHWPTDVAGGMILGAVWLVATRWAFLPLHAAARVTAARLGSTATARARSRRASVEGTRPGVG